MQQQTQLRHDKAATVSLMAHTGDEIAYINMQKGRAGKNAISYTCNCSSLLLIVFHLLTHGNKK
jgi:hypothetical protein